MVARVIPILMITRQVHTDKAGPMSNQEQSPQVRIQPGQQDAWPGMTAIQLDLETGTFTA